MFGPLQRPLPTLLVVFAACACAAVAPAQTTWRQVARFTPPPTTDHYYLFGYSVAYSAGSVLVGAPESRPGGSGESGWFDTSFGFDRLSRELNYEYRDSPFARSSHHYGTAVAANDDTVVVTNADRGALYSGNAFLFDQSSGQLLDTVKSDQPVHDELFGLSAALNDDYLLVGAPSWGGGDGSAYLFSLETGEQLYRFHEPLPFNSAYGSSVELSDNYAFVGVPSAGTPVTGSSGAVYVYSLESGEQVGELNAPPYVGRDFGQTLDIDGNLLIVGDPEARIDGSSSGAAFIFDISTGELLHQLVAPLGQAGDFFGRSVAIDDGVAVVGAYGDDEKGDYAGAAYVFDTHSGGFITKLTAPDAFQWAEFGLSVDVDDGEVLVGAPEAYGRPNSGSTGVAYAFRAVLRGDYNGDGTVGQADYEVWAGAYGRTNGDLLADGNGDGVVDAADYAIWRDAYAAAPLSASVPEPGTVLLLLASAGALGVPVRR